MNIKPLGDRVVVKVLEKRKPPRAELCCPKPQRKNPGR